MVKRQPTLPGGVDDGPRIDWVLCAVGRGIVVAAVQLEQLATRALWSENRQRERRLCCG
jgi:hypothetical protein